VSDPSPLLIFSPAGLAQELVEAVTTSAGQAHPPQQGLVLRGPIILRYQDRGASFTFHSAADIAHDAIDDDGKAPFIEPPDQDIALLGVHHDRSASIGNYAISGPIAEARALVRLSLRHPAGLPAQEQHLAKFSWNSDLRCMNWDLKCELALSTGR